MTNRTTPARLLAVATLVACTAIVLSGCDKFKGKASAPPPASVVAVTSDFTANTSQLCMFANIEEAGKCKSGQTAFFAPQSWGNEQFPVVVAAKYCDFNHPIVLTNGGVACVFFKGRLLYKPDAPKDEPTAPSN